MCLSKEKPFPHYFGLWSQLSRQVWDTNLICGFENSTSPTVVPKSEAVRRTRSNKQYKYLTTSGPLSPTCVHVKSSFQATLFVAEDTPQRLPYIYDQEQQKTLTATPPTFFESQKSYQNLNKLSFIACFRKKSFLPPPPTKKWKGQSCSLAKVFLLTKQTFYPQMKVFPNLCFATRSHTFHGTAKKSIFLLFLYSSFHPCETQD